MNPIEEIGYVIGFSVGVLFFLALALMVVGLTVWIVKMVSSKK